jgi:hypothetical protein
MGGIVPACSGRMTQRTLWTALLVAGMTAQAGSQVSTAQPFGAWLEVGAGGGVVQSDHGTAALAASGHLQMNRVLWSARWDGVVTGWSSDVDQFALLLGLATRRSDARFASLSIGAGFVQAQLCDHGCGLLSTPAETQKHTESAVGIAFAAQTALRAGNQGGVGIGLVSAGNINSLSSFATLGLTVSVGRWR